MSERSGIGSWLVRCPVCGRESNWVVRLTSDASELFDVHRCVSCGLCFIPSLQLASKRLANIYDQQFYDTTLCVDLSPAREELERKVVEKLLQTLEKHLPTKGRMLDVGCGDGVHLKLFHDWGWEVMGTEVSAYAVRHIRSRYGFDVFEGELADASLEAEQFDYVQMRHVIEHLHDPVPTLNRIRELLRPSGVLRIDTPTVGLVATWMPRIDGIARPLAIAKRRLQGRRLSAEDQSRWGDLHPPEHNLWFTLPALDQLLMSIGFNVISLGTTYRGDPDHYPAKHVLDGRRAGWWDHLWHYGDVVGARLGRGSVAVVYAQKPFETAGPTSSREFVPGGAERESYIRL